VFFGSLIFLCSERVAHPDSPLPLRIWEMLAEYKLIVRKQYWYYVIRRSLQLVLACSCSRDDQYNKEYKERSAHPIPQLRRTRFDREACYRRPKIQ
jgi:hypothetical protein